MSEFGKEIEAEARREARMLRAMKLRQSGATWKEVGQALGVSAGRARIWVDRGEWWFAGGREPLPEWAKDLGLPHHLASQIVFIGIEDKQELLDAIATPSACEKWRWSWIGKTTIKRLRAHFGMDVSKKNRTPRLGIERATKFLERHGYKVTKAAGEMTSAVYRNVPEQPRRHAAGQSPRDQVARDRHADAGQDE